MRNNIRLVIADVDGTLLTRDKVLTAGAIEAVELLRNADIAFTITSGRPPLGMKMLVDPLGITEPVAAFNGGVLVHPDCSVMTQSFVTADNAAKVIGCSLAALLSGRYSPDANKGHVVAVLSHALSIPPAQIATIGDLPNDVLMFEKSGLSIAMGNTSSDVQQHAHFITSSNEDEGFAHAMEPLSSGSVILWARHPESDSLRIKRESSLSAPGLMTLESCCILGALPLPTLTGVRCLPRRWRRIISGSGRRCASPAEPAPWR